MIDYEITTGTIKFNPDLIDTKGTIVNTADQEYRGIIKDIVHNGKWDKDVRPKWEDGKPALTKSVLNQRMIFDNGSVVPILTQKRVPQKDPINEMFWIWRDKSNVVQDLNDMGCKVWDKWKNKQGTIGKAYGWQLAHKRRTVKITPELLEMMKNGEISENRHYVPFNAMSLDQVDYLIYTLKTNPTSRRIKTSLWGVEDLDEMELEPCVYDTHWQVWDDKLHLTVNIRSNDMALGNPYNVYQYSVLHRLIAQVTNHKVGTITFNIDNAHIYNRHIDKLTEQIGKDMHEPPTLWINPDVKSFYDFTIDDIKLTNYNHSGSIKFEVAV